MSEINADKLKRLKKEIRRKEFWRETRDCRDYVTEEICDAEDYGAEERYTYPEWMRKAILALIAENERAENMRDKATHQVSVWIEHHDRVNFQLSEVVALLREFMNEGDTSSVYNDVRDFLARIDATNHTVA